MLLLVTVVRASGEDFFVFTGDVGLNVGVFQRRRFVLLRVMGIVVLPPRVRLDAR